jgi:hypothetical protein
MQAMKKLLKGQSAQSMLNLYMVLLKNYRDWYKRFIRNDKRKQKHGTTATDTEERYGSLILMGPYLTGFTFN